MVIANHPRAKIGTPGSGINLGISTGPSGLAVTLSNGFYLLLITVLGCFGPGALTFLLTHPEEFSPPPPRLITGLFAFIILACTYATGHLLVTWLFRRPKLFFHDHGLLHTKGSQELWRLPAADIAAFHLDEYFYESEGHKTRNPVLVVTSKKGETTNLIVCSNEKQMDQLLAAARHIYRLPAPKT